MRPTLLCIGLFLLCSVLPASGRDSQAILRGEDGDLRAAAGSEAPSVLDTVATWLSGLLYLNPRFGGSESKPQLDWERDSPAVVVTASARTRPGRPKGKAERPPTREHSPPPPVLQSPPPPDRASRGWPLVDPTNVADQGEEEAEQVRQAESQANAKLARAAAVALPKVALMFLTRGDMPYEEAWRFFLEGFPLQGADGMAGWQRAFSLHVHPSQGHEYAPGSLFHGRAVAKREKVEWGQWSVMQAERNLMEAALADPLAQRFVLLSESCIPLYPAALVWAQLMAEPRSRIHACVNASNPEDEGRRMTFRMVNMERDGLQQQHWRKSGQWIALNRKHAELVVNDTLVSRLFREECWVDADHLAKGEPLWRFCVSDEHYVPTLLAFHGLEAETDCTGAATNAWWDGPYFHPRTWEDGEVSLELIAKLRKSNHGFEPSEEPECDATAALATAPLVLAADGAAGLANPGLGSSEQSRRHQAVEHAKLKQQDSSRRLLAARAGGRLPPEAFWMQLAVTQPGSPAWRQLLSLPAEAGDAFQEAAHTGLGMAAPGRRPSQEQAGDAAQEADWAWVAEALKGYKGMTDPNCPLFARKFSAGAAGLVANITKAGFARRKHW